MIPKELIETKMNCDLNFKMTLFSLFLLFSNTIAISRISVHSSKIAHARVLAYESSTPVFKMLHFLFFFFKLREKNCSLSLLSHNLISKNLFSQQAVGPVRQFVHLKA